ncbi:hypothetical protein [Dyella sp. EPa41]|uniref:hypothetical protein n=1 Tax=Dyella sp. EPa41 TaxID=1561194 RepID=UPI001916BD2F|nr:hypothetical protein [Dyella sp. EPa41]
MSDVHAQQQPAASSSVATSPRASVVTPAHAAPHGHATASSKTPSTSRVKASVAVNATADVEKAQGRYQAPRRDYMDSYRNAVTPPVDSGR